MASTSSFIVSLHSAPTAPGDAAGVCPGGARGTAWQNGRSGDLLFAQEAADGVAGLGATAEPVFYALGIQFHLGRILQRIVRTHDFYGPAVARPPLVHHHNAVKRPLLLANSRQADSQHSVSLHRDYSLSAAFWGTESSPAGLHPGELAQAAELAFGRGGAELLDHPAHLHILLQDLVDILHGGAAAAGDAFAPLAVNEAVVVALGRGHGIDDGLDALQTPFVHLGVAREIRQRADLGQHAHHLLERAHLAELL